MVGFDGPASAASCGLVHGSEVRQGHLHRVPLARCAAAYGVPRKSSGSVAIQSKLGQGIAVRLCPPLLAARQAVSQNTKFSVQSTFDATWSNDYAVGCDRSGAVGGQNR
jgi:hypothetical protein